jgi:hypothetical protein
MSLHHSTKTAKLALLTAVMIPAAAANAAVIVFTIDGTEGASSYTTTQGGITMDFLPNPTEGGGNNAYAFGFPGSHGDLNLSQPGVFVSAFTLKFSADVTITGYNVGSEDITSNGVPGGTFDLTASGSTTSAGNLLSTSGDHSLSGGGFSLSANTVATWTAHDIPGGTYIGIHSITVTTVPEPGEWATITAAGCGAAALLLRRRRQSH